MKVSLILVLLVVALSSGGKKKKTSGGGFDFKDWLRKLRRPTTSAPTVKPTVKPTALQSGFDLLAVNSTEAFYKTFPNVPRLPQHKKGYKRPQVGIDSAVEMDQSKWYCTHRPTLVGLPKPGYGEGFLFPSCALLNRCTGCCPLSDITTCKPYLIRMTTVDYYRISSFGSPGMSMSAAPVAMNVVQESIQMEEHIGCRCDCIKSSSSCNSRQDWNPNQCKCVCKPQFQIHNMQCPKDFKYDPGSCSCVCSKAREDCPPHMKWSTADCRCVCKDNSRCPMWHYRHPVSCQCVRSK